MEAQPASDDKPKRKATPAHKVEIPEGETALEAWAIGFVLERLPPKQTPKQLMATKAVPEYVKCALEYARAVEGVKAAGDVHPEAVIDAILDTYAERVRQRALDGIPEKRPKKRHPKPAE